MAAHVPSHEAFCHGVRLLKTQGPTDTHCYVKSASSWQQPCEHRNTLSACQLYAPPKTGDG